MRVQDHEVKGRLVLVVTADEDVRHRISAWLRDFGHEPPVVASGASALIELGTKHFALTLVDLDSEGTEIVGRLSTEGGTPGVVVGLASVSNGFEATRPSELGVHHVLPKPFTPQDLESVLKQALSKRATWSRASEDDAHQRLLQEIGLWQSFKMREVREIIEQAARADVTVLIAGETGTGKDLVARAIHHASSRQRGPFVKVNCAAVPRELLESELFGHERGAFTGAHQLKIGKFEEADRGTIFLDEIGDLHPALQGKLLHVLQDGSFSRVGGRSTVEVDVRVLAATNRDLEQAVASGRFREDLYYRLNVIQIVVPPLRERSSEIPILAEYFIRRYSDLFRREAFKPPPETIARLMRYRFPGNVRELENMIKRMIVLGDPLLRRTPLSSRMSGGEEGEAGRPAAAAAASLREIGRRAAPLAEREAILHALEETHWNRVRAAKLLQVSYRALLYKIKDGGLDRDRRVQRT
jgi:two-component system response regulator AtoC